MGKRKAKAMQFFTAQKSLRNKIMLIFTSVGVVILLISMLVSAIMTSNTTRRLNGKNLALSAEFYSEKASSWLNSAASVLGPMQLFMEERVADGADASVIRAYNESLTAKYDYADDIYSALSDSTFYDGTGWIPGDDWSCTTREWFTAPQERDDIFYGSPYLSSSTGSIVSAVALPFHVDGKVAGMVAMDIKLDELASLINGYLEGTKDYFILTDIHGNIVMHANEEFKPTADMTSNINEVMGGKYITAAQKGSSMRDYNGKRVYVAGAPIGESGWTLYLVEPASVYTKDLRNLVILFVLVFLLGNAALVYVTYSVSSSIVKPIIAVKDAAIKVADGNFNVDITSESEDEIGQLADSMKKMCHNTNSVIEDLGQILGEMEKGNLVAKSRDASIYTGDYLRLITSIRNFREKITDALTYINEVSDQVLGGSEKVSTGAQGVSRGTTEQASAIQELAATITEVSDNISENAKSAEEAMNNTRAAGEKMQYANEKLNELVSAMNETKECSRQIGTIISTIEDIASQTNLLSLNASIEAARAGEAGRGFAVVADEVGSLAVKSAEAVKDVHSLIANTIESVERGDKLVNDLANTMAMVSEAAQTVVVCNTNICDSSAGIADSIEQINKGVEQIADVVQTNVMIAEQSAESSEELSGQAQTLKQLVGEFVLS